LQRWGFGHERADGRRLGFRGVGISGVGKPFGLFWQTAAARSHQSSKSDGIRCTFHKFRMLRFSNFNNAVMAKHYREQEEPREPDEPVKRD